MAVSGFGGGASVVLVQWTQGRGRTDHSGKGALEPRASSRCSELAVEIRDELPQVREGALERLVRGLAQRALHVTDEP